MSNFKTIERRLDRVEALIGMMATRDELHGLENRMMARMDDIVTGMDYMTTILQRLDQERVFTNERLQRVETDIGQVKKHLQL